MLNEHSRGGDNAKRLENFHKENYPSEKVLRMVTVRDVESGEVETHEILDESPLGVATRNKKVGEIVQVSAPGGTYEVEILEME